MPSEGESSQPPFPWPWFIALIVCAMGTGVGFGISPRLGLAMACLTVVVFAGFMVWAIRQGRRRRAAGYTPDIPDLQRRLGSRLKWHVPFALLAVVTCLIALVVRDDDTPIWIFIAPAALILFATGWLWFVTEHLLPRIHLKQESRSRSEGTTP